MNRCVAAPLPAWLWLGYNPGPGSCSLPLECSVVGADPWGLTQRSPGFPAAGAGTRLYFSGCFALCGPSSGKGHHGCVCCSGLCGTPDPGQREWFQHVSPCEMCQRVPLALGDSRRREQSALSLHHSSAVEAVPSPCSLSPFKSIKQPDKNTLDPFNAGICCQLVSGAASLLSGLLFEVSFSCRAVDALRSAGVTGCLLCLARRPIPGEGLAKPWGSRSLGSGAVILQPRCAGWS